MRVIPLFSLIALAAPLTSAFALSAPTNPTSDEITQIHWGFTPRTLWRVRLQGNHWRESSTNLGQITTLWPVLPAGAGYQLRAVDVTNVDRVLAFSPAFAMAV
ncbi:hypothetical protein B0H17DRAFT_1336897 [Mycena rosella]|uniref:Uncharacterized protein n=1 Tax=Mycena rosella TaxID=1033263 RepID=A0AAD7CTH4_MYCRO|nr:hypothetical protein B0H17DRAFT_1336897 [Mycena rosella]